MPFALSWRAMLLSVVAIPLFSAQSANALRPADRDESQTSLFGHHRQQTCAQTVHERVKAVMDGVPNTHSGKRTVATNRDCR
jgi:hypothetical protein